MLRMASPVPFVKHKCALFPSRCGCLQLKVVDMALRSARQAATCVLCSCKGVLHAHASLDVKSTVLHAVSSLQVRRPVCQAPKAVISRANQPDTAPYYYKPDTSAASVNYTRSTLQSQVGIDADAKRQPCFKPRFSPTISWLQL